MSLFRPREERNVVPRWRPSRAFASARELEGARPSERHQVDFRRSIIDRQREFEATPNAWTAADLLATLRTAGATVSSDVRDRALSALKSGPFPDTTKSLLGSVAPPNVMPPETLQFTTLSNLDDHFRTRVQQLRSYLRDHPRSSFRWLDLALAQVTLGNEASATRSIRNALNLSPQNRLVLRSAARFFAHTGQHDEALYWLNGARRLQNDPWLLSAHIAISRLASTPITVMRTAREVLTDQLVSPYSASELTAAIASEELRAGRDKRARRLMSEATVDPTDNALAQAVWSRDHGLSDVGVEASAPRAYEAEARDAIQAADWQRAGRAATAWLADEPFSVSAAMNASYIALTGLEDYSRALDYAELGLRTHPSNAMLLNNAAFASARLGQVQDADSYLDRAVGGDDVESAMLLATRGLTRFRAGEVEIGRDLYRRASASFRQDDAREFMNLCQIMWSLEEARAQTPLGTNLYKQLREVPTTSIDAQVWLQRLRRQLRQS